MSASPTATPPVNPCAIGNRHGHLTYAPRKTFGRSQPKTLTTRPTPAERLQNWLQNAKVSLENTRWPLTMRLPKKTGLSSDTVYVDKDGAAHLGTPEGEIIGHLACLTQSS